MDTEPDPAFHHRRWIDGFHTGFSKGHASGARAGAMVGALLGALLTAGVIGAARLIAYIGAALS